ncbi:hypothetical protein PMI27_000640 [Pseudomonas sp. GM41(2012)]|uniref:hypothetical protein n=1 Tax=Pseudomonas sp. (strain GM41(2012)) TaxID=1144708 RepID=UPI000270541E|nr:hypothetical protein [Pseudomonas sp. GM41(2012)]EUB74464.1 hypothetical protein PMI27_000640 [Pseudomonas sp. GM41(2012)]
MAKPNEVLSTEQPQPQPQRSTDLKLKFRDKVYTSRTLIIPESDRTLPVVKGCVEVSASDEQAVSYLKAHAEFEPQG